MSFRIALSGLNAASTDLSVTAHNVANINTTGFKRSRAEFGDVFPVSTFGLSRNAVGAGVGVSRIAQQFSQGNIDFTDNALDLAVSGGGFFTLSDGGTLSYSRAGNFGVDRDGYVINPTGARLQVFPPSTSGVGFDTGRLTDIQLSNADNPPAATENVVVGTNLPANAVAPLTAVFDPLDPTSYNHTTSLSVYDSLGVAHIARLYYVKTETPAVATVSVASGAYTPATSATASDAYQLRIDGTTVSDRLVAAATAANLDTDVAAFVAASGGAYTQTGTVAGGDLVLTRVDGNDLVIATSFSNAIGSTAAAVGATGGGTFAGAGFVGTHAGGTPAFPTPNQWQLNAAIEENGVLSVLGAPLPATLQYDTSGALTTPVPPSVLTLPAYTPSTGAAAFALMLDLSASSQYGETFNVSRLTQDGYTTGRLAGLEVSPEGTVFSRYSNGQTQGLGQVALSTFANEQGLQNLGATAWGETFDSGQPLRGTAGSASFGLIQAGALEASNVDLTEQLVSMITAQRNFQANAQVIQASDQITQTIINIR